MVIAVIAVVLATTLAGAVVGFVVGRRHQEPDTPLVRDPSGQIRRTAGPDAVALREAVDRLEVGVVVFDADGDISYRNSVAMAMRGTHTGLIVDDRVAQAVDQIERGGPTELIVELHGPPKLIFAIDAKPLPAGGAVATIHDMSERARIDAMRTDFVANISHELKTPVGAIAVLAETLQDEIGQDEIGQDEIGQDELPPNRQATAVDLAGRLVDEAHRAVRTIDDLLALSQIESTRPSDEIVDLSAVIETAITRGRSLAAGMDVEISGVAEDRPIRVRGDRRQLASALGNLVENAVKYSGERGVVEVRARHEAPWTELIVTDHGVGIPARDLDRVFERFYRVDKARTRGTGGTGLGLAIVRHVASNHGGDVLVTSAEGVGSTFVLRLPSDRLIGDSDEPVGDLRDTGDEGSGH